LNSAAQAPPFRQLLYQAKNFSHSLTKTGAFCAVWLSKGIAAVFEFPVGHQCKYLA
jgi:hypothetical protein